MNLYRLSKEAEKDLEDLWVYLAERNDIAGDRQVAKLLDRFPMLAQFPTMGVFCAKDLFFVLQQSVRHNRPSIARVHHAKK